MHLGKDTEFYLKKGFRVIGIEANPYLAEITGKNFENEIKSGDLVLINKAVAENEGEISFYIDKRKED